MIPNLVKESEEGKEAKAKLRVLEQEFRQKTEQFSRAEQKFALTKILYEKTIEEKDRLFEQIQKKNNESFKCVSSLIADHLTLQYEISAKFLETKKNPAYMEARRIRELREKAKELQQINKILEYKYEFLFQLFPDLELYVDDIESIRDLNTVETIKDLEDATDRTRYYLSKEEYDRLPEEERNQMALDRYIQSQKSKWQIGRDYELCIGYKYANDGWNVEFFGIDKQLEDMGRDLIATKGNEIHIVQCKYWSQQKLIHEKHIAQLYGTTIQYAISLRSGKKVVPVFVTNISLSNTARDFAKHLDVKLLENKPLTEFPRIKCNINRDESGKETRIYHLPMDQQYDKAKVCKKGEFFAFTVREAVKAGFRRAWRWYGNG